MNRKRMADLADIIENNRLPNVTSDPECSTAECIAGYTICAAYGNRKARSEFWPWGEAKIAAARILGLDLDQATALFKPRNPAGDILPKTRKQAAAVLRHAAKTGKIDWSVA